MRKVGQLLYDIADVGRYPEDGARGHCNNFLPARRQAGKTPPPPIVDLAFVFLGSASFFRIGRLSHVLSIVVA